MAAFTSLYRLIATEVAGGNAGSGSPVSAAAILLQSG